MYKVLFAEDELLVRLGLQKVKKEDSRVHGMTEINRETV